MKSIVLDDIRALQKNETWNLVELPQGKKVVGSKWMFMVKVRPMVR